MIIRKFKQKDAEMCQEIIYDCIEISKKTTRSDKENLRKKYSLKKIIGYSKISDFFICGEKRNVIGMGRLEGNKLATIYFDPKFHGRGGGTLIIKKLESLARRRKIRRVYLEALLQAVGFYEKNGFKKLKRILKPINSMKMEKIL